MVFLQSKLPEGAEKLFSLLFLILLLGALYITFKIFNKNIRRNQK